MFQAGKAVERVDSVGAVAAGEQPAVLGQVEVRNDQLDDGLEGFEAADKDGSMGLGRCQLGTAATEESTRTQGHP